MGFFEDLYRHYSPFEAFARGDWKEGLNRITPGRILADVTGYTQYQNTKASNQLQIDYNTYMSGGNSRAYQDWLKNVGSKGRSIRYPELSYPGAMFGYDTGSARAMYGSDSAMANYIGNLPYRGAGLYGIASKASRMM